jgi:bifunctional non-homologous end joining protein LigD
VTDTAGTPLDIRRGTAAGPRMPDAIRPMLAAQAPQPFDSPGYIFELMWGGLRAMAYVREGRVRLRGRNGIDLTPSFPELGCIAERTRAREAILDGEIVAIDGEGHPSFDLLRPRLEGLADLRRRQTPDAVPEHLKVKRGAGQLTFQAFDLLWLDGRGLAERPLWQRKNRLAEVVMAGPEFGAVDFVDDEGVAFFEAVVQRRLEGVVAKEKASVYTPGRRSRSWLEVRALQSGDFVVGGYTFGGTRRRGEPFGQLLLGGYADGRLEYVGAVSGGLSDREARRLVAQMEPLLADGSPFFDTPPVHRLVFWTRPELVCHVRFSEWSRDGQLRFPIFSALRPDMDARDCTIEP